MSIGRMTSLLVVVVLLPSCGPGKVTGVSSGGRSWYVAAEAPIPGIHQGAAEVISLKYGSPQGVTTVVWCAQASGSSIQSRGDSKGAFSEGHFLFKENDQVDFRCETKDGSSAQVTIAGQNFDTKKGSLFLISKQATETKVLQLQADVRNFPSDTSAIIDFAESNPEIVRFFTDARTTSP